MNSRKRLLRVLEGKLPDRVPISTYELCGWNSRAFENSEPSYAGLMDFIRGNTDTLTMWNPRSDEAYVFSAYRPETHEEISDEGGYHVRRVTVNAGGRMLTQTSKYTDNLKTVWNVEHICKDLHDVDALMNMPYVPPAYDAGDFGRVSAETGDNGLIMASVADPACVAMEIMEFGEAMVWAMSEPDHFKATLDELHRRNMRNLENMLQTQTADLYRICGPEYITPPYLPPAHFERFVYPYLCDMVKLIHRYDAKARIHCHGRVGKVLDYILDTGADALDPCEAPPDGDITLADIKKRAAGRLCLFGNLQLKLLEHGTEQEVRDCVKGCMDAAKEGGGYVIMPTSAPINIPLSPKTEANYRVFIQTALEYGQYK